jgi:hypothetical protein
MDARDRRFFSWLAIVFGPLFVLGGFLFAFTIEGAIFVWVGLCMLAGGIALRTPLPVWAVMTAAAGSALALSAWTVISYA